MIPNPVGIWESHDQLIKTLDLGAIEWSRFCGA